MPIPRLAALAAMAGLVAGCGLFDSAATIASSALDATATVVGATVDVTTDVVDTTAGVMEDTADAAAEPFTE